MSNASAISDGLLLSRDGAIATLTLNRPESHNALTAADLMTLAEILKDIGGDKDIRCVVLTGAGEKTFSSGASLTEVSGQGGGDWAKNPLTQVSDALQNMAQPTIAALNGSVYGGATEIVLACDFRIGIDGMRLSVPPARFSIHYPPSGLQLMVTRLGLQAAKRLSLMAEIMETDALKEIGFCDYWVDRADFDETVGEISQTLADLAPLAVQAMKQSLNELAAGTADPKVMARRVAECWASEDRVEAFAARAESRKANFKAQ